MASLSVNQVSKRLTQSHSHHTRFERKPANDAMRISPRKSGHTDRNRPRPDPLDIEWQKADQPSLFADRQARQRAACAEMILPGPDPSRSEIDFRICPVSKGLPFRMQGPERLWLLNPAYLPFLQDRSHHLGYGILTKEVVSHSRH